MSRASYIKRKMRPENRELLVQRLLENRLTLEEIATEQRGLGETVSVAQVSHFAKEQKRIMRDGPLLPILREENRRLRHKLRKLLRTPKGELSLENLRLQDEVNRLRQELARLHQLLELKG